MDFSCSTSSSRSPTVSVGGFLALEKEFSHIWCIFFVVFAKIAAKNVPICTQSSTEIFDCISLWDFFLNHCFSLLESGEQNDSGVTNIFTTLACSEFPVTCSVKYWTLEAKFMNPWEMLWTLGPADRTKDEPKMFFRPGFVHTLIELFDFLTYIYIFFFLIFSDHIQSLSGVN